MNVWTVILNWNGCDDTAACLRSLRAARLPEATSWTRLVVDNGSTDRSREILPAEFPEARFLSNGANLRWAGGNNRGLELAFREGADGAWLLNNDTEVEADALATMIAAARAHPNAGLLGPTILDGEGRVWSAGGDVWPAFGWAAHRDLGAPWPPATGVAGPDASPTGYLTGAALWVTRAAFERIGGLDEGYYLYGEDADAALRAREAGLEVLYVPRAVVRHRVSGTSGKSSPFKAYHRTRAGLRLAQRHARGAGRLVSMVVFPLLTLVQGVVWCVRGGGPAALAAALRGVWDGVRGADPAASPYAPKREVA